MRIDLKPYLSRSRILLALIATLSSSLRAAEAPPSYSVRFLGPGSVVAINNADTVVGLTTSTTTGAQTPWISVAGTAWTPLPLPSGASGAFPTDLNDADVVVGVATFPTGRRAIRWVPNGPSFGVDLLPLLPGEAASYATGINNLGQIVGARAGILGTPFGFGWLYSDSGGLVGLEAAYGWFATPNDINDAGIILSGTQTMNLATGAVTDVGLAGPSNYNPIGGVAINDAGQIAGTASLGSTSLNVISAFRFLPATGWEFIAGSSRYTVANDINNLGDMGWGELGAGVYLDGLGTYAVGNLLSASASTEGWTITGNGCLLNDQRVIATVGRNSLTGQSGAVLLTPDGVLPTPSAPTSLTAVPHPATASEPYVSINLSWVNGDLLLTRSYELERRVVGAPDWMSIPLVPPGSSTAHQDTTVAPATPYEYRVRAVGIAGPGAWSTIASATSPATPAPTLRVTDIVLTGKIQGSRVTVTGLVQIRDAGGSAVRNATVSVRWKLPNGSTQTASARTDSAGRATLTVSSARGTYQLTVTGVAKAGYVFDPAGSVLSKSITK